MGGFEKKSNVAYFTRFAEKIMSELGNSVRLVITINEPEVYANESYYQGNWPPNLTSKRKLRRVLINLAHAHNETAKLLHQQSRRFKVSIAKNSAFFYAGDDAVLSRKVSDLLQHFQDDYFLKKVVKQCDFLGINYYFSNRVYGYRIHNADQRVSDLGWDLNPAALQQALERVHDAYHLPVLVTENGLADSDDHYRQWWIMNSLVAMQRATEHGVDMMGYLHWSLIDNFEWDKGFWPEFGLLSVDRTTFKRSPRPSAIWFAGIIKKIRSQHS
jgi:beta-glucosidase